MSQENVELARLLFEAFRTAPETGGYDAAIDLIDDAPLDPEVEWDPRAVAETFGVPDINQVYVGIEGEGRSGGSGSPPGRQSPSTMNSSTPETK